MWWHEVMRRTSARYPLPESSRRPRRGLRASGRFAATTASPARVSGSSLLSGQRDRGQCRDDGGPTRIRRPSPCRSSRRSASTSEGSTSIGRARFIGSSRLRAPLLRPSESSPGQATAASPAAATAAPPNPTPAPQSWPVQPGLDHRRLGCNLGGADVAGPLAPQQTGFRLPARRLSRPSRQRRRLHKITGRSLDISLWEAPPSPARLQQGQLPVLRYAHALRQARYRALQLRLGIHETRLDSAFPLR